MSRPYLLQRILALINNQLGRNARRSACTQSHFSWERKLAAPIFSSPMRRAQSAPLKCWKCGVEKRHSTDLFCERCSVIQTPYNTQNYFKVFDLDNGFDVDTKLLQQKYRRMQSLLHPDKFSNSTDMELKISQEYSSLVNKAHDTLLVPLKRALHLLSLNGLSIDEDQTGTSSEFLMEVMELNEEVDDAVSADELRKLSLKNREVMERLVVEVSEHFRNGHIDRAKETVLRMKYYNSIAKRLNELLREKGIVD